jgi:hypothetical protein
LYRDRALENAFQLAIDMFNLENNKSDIRLAYQIERFANGDSFHAIKLGK